MQSLLYFLKSAPLAELATPSNIRLAKEIVNEGEVEIIAFEPGRIIARVTPEEGNRRQVRLSVTKRGFSAKCSCSKDAVFCKHITAAALTVRKIQSPRKAIVRG